MKLYLAIIFVLVVILFTGFSTSQDSVYSTVEDICANYSADSLEFLRLWSMYVDLDNRNQHDSAVIICKQIISLGDSLEMCKSDSSVYEKYAKAYGGIGWNLMMLQHLDEARVYQQKSLDLLTERFGPYHIRITEVLNGIATNYKERGDYAAANKYYFKSLHVMSKIFKEKHHYIGNNYYNIAHTYHASGDYNQALNYFRMAIGVHKEVAPDMLSIAEEYGTMALILTKMRRYSEGLRMLDDAEDYNENIADNGNFKPLIHYFRSLIALEGGYPIKALPIIQEAIGMPFRTESEVGYNKGSFYQLLAQVYSALYRSVEARSALMEAISFYDNYHGPAHRNAIECFILAGKSYAEDHLYDQGIFQIQAAMHLVMPEFEKNQLDKNPDGIHFRNNSVILDLLKVKAELWKEKYNYSCKKYDLEKSLDTYKSALLFIQECRTTFQWESSKFHLQGIVASLLEEGLSTACRVYELSQDLSDLETALAFCEEKKSILLYSGVRLHDMQITYGIPDDLLECGRSIRYELDRYEREIDRRNRSGESMNYIQDLVALQLEWKLSQDSLLEIYRKNYPAYYAANFEAARPSFNNIQSKLANNETMLSYSLTGHEIFLFIIDKDSVYIRRTEIDTNFINDISKFRALISSKPKQFEGIAQLQIDSFVSLNHRLYETLFRPAASLLRGTNLIIVPEDVLHFIPFQILIEEYPDSGSYHFRRFDYLVRQYSFRYEHSALLFSLPSDRRNRAKYSYLGMAPSYNTKMDFERRPYQSDIQDQETWPSELKFAELKSNDIEVCQLQEVFEGSVFLGAEATKAKFVTNVPDYRVIHLAMHSYIEDRDPLRSGFIFSHNENQPLDSCFLYAYELYNMNLSAELAILSSCNSGIGKIQKGEGVMSLCRAFKYAGCPNIMMSLWSINDHSAKDVVIAYSNYLQRGYGKAQALQMAQNNFLETADEAYTHPYYWAAFVLVGDNLAVNINDGMNKWIIAAIVFLVLGCGYYIRTRHKRS